MSCLSDLPKLKVITVKYDDSIKPGEEKTLKTPIYMSTLLGKGASKEVQTLVGDSELHDVSAGLSH